MTGDSETPETRRDLAPGRDRWLQVPQGYEVVVDNGEQQEEPEKHLWDFLLMIWQRRWLVLGVFLLCVVPAILYVRNVKPVPMYTATAKVRIDGGNPDLASLGADSQSASRSYRPGDSVNTQAEVLRSGKLLGSVLAELDAAAKDSPTSATQIASGPARQPGLLEKAQTKLAEARVWLLGPPPKAIAPADPDLAVREARIAALRMGLTIQPLDGTQIIQLAYTSPDPNYSAQVLNTLCDNFKEFDYESKSESYAEARQWLQAKINDMKTTLATSEQALIDFTGGSSAEFLAMANDGKDYRDKLDETESKLAALEDQYVVMKYQVDKLDQGVPADLVISDENTAKVAGLRSQIDQLEAQEAKLATTLGPRMTPVKELQAQRKELETQLADTLTRTRTKLQMDFARVSAERERLQKSLTNQQQAVVAMQGRLSRYSILKRDVQINTQMLDNLIQKWKVIGLSQGMNASNVSILEAAVAPLAPLPGSSSRVLLVSIVLGLGLGIGLVFFLNYMNVSFRSAEEIARVFHLPVMASIPFCALGRRQRRQVKPELVSHHLPYSGYADLYRGLRTSTQFAIGNGKCRKVLVSSALPGEGKTTVASNLAVTFAQKGARTLLIDADLKDPSLTTVFGVKAKPGLTNLLSNAKPDATTQWVDSDAIRQTNVPNLDLLTSGPKVPNPVDLLESKAMRAFLTWCEERYDYVILDTAPLIELADTSVLGPHVDGMLFVMRPGKTPRRLAIEAKDRLLGMGTRIIGVVVNYPTKSLQKRYNVGFARYVYGGYNGRGGCGRYGRSRNHDLEQISEASGDSRFLLPPGKLN